MIWLRYSLRQKYGVNDGDKSLVVADPLFVGIAERHMQGIVPLHYKMGKAGATPLDAQTLYEGIILAYSEGKVGGISNQISKIWNSSNVDLEAIKILCASVNYSIDFCKTLYKPTIPPEKEKKIRELIGCKVPHFFIYAKDKENDKVEPLNNSVVNRLEKFIKDYRMSYKDVGIFKFDYKELMSNSNVRETENIVAAYDELYNRFRNSFADLDDLNQLSYVQIEATSVLSRIAGSPSMACDMLIHYLFKTHDSARQRLFWACFAGMVLSNLECHLSGSMYCAKCGQRIQKESNNQKLCKTCSAGYRKIQQKTLACADCKKEFVVSGSSKNIKRCHDCQQKKNLERYRKYNNKKKEKNKEA